MPNSSGTSSKQTDASTDFVEKLRASLGRDGDFPASAKVVSELRMIVNDPKTTANQVTELILREPSLGTRVLHLVNSSYYRRAKPIMTVSQAVLQIGMRPLAELCAGLILLQRFVPAARRGGPFATCLQKTILTSLLAGNISNNKVKTKVTKSDETGYLAGSFSEIGTLLLAYYFPQVYEGALERSNLKRQELRLSIKELTGLSPTQISIEVIQALKLPNFYLESLTALDSIIEGKEAPATAGATVADSVRVAKTLGAAQKIASAVVSAKGKSEVDAAIKSAKSLLGSDAQGLESVIGNLPSVFKDHCSSLELSLPNLPEFVATYSDTNTTGTATPTPEAKEDTFGKFVEEIRLAVESREPAASIITTVMETFAWSLGFKRVLLLLVTANRKSLVGKMLIGGGADFDPKSFERSVGADASISACEVRAFKESVPVFSGDPIFEDGWPIAVIPIGFGPRAVGVIYADKPEGDGPELTNREQAAIGVLAELLDKAVGSSY